MSNSVTAIIPAWNEATRISRTVEAVRRIPEVSRILVVDDGSHDATAENARTAGADVLVMPYNSGKGQALQAGIAHCSSDVLLLLDADLEDSATEAKLLLKPILDGQADMTIARFPRQKTAGFGLVRGLARWGIRCLAGMDVESPLSGQRAIRRGVLDRIRLAQGWGIEVALTIDAVRYGYRVVEIPVTMRHRHTGRDWRGFMHRGRQFGGVLRALLVRVLRIEGLAS